MLFSSIAFLYYFLPVVFVFYFALPIKARNAVLLIASLAFYYYGERGYVWLLIFSSALDYAAGLLIERFRGGVGARLALFGSITGNLGVLFFFKYAGFFSGGLIKIALPLGVSFFTFQTMSYSIDVYRGDAPVQRNPFSFATYVSLFPQLVAGPIVRYQTVAEEISSRKITVSDFAAGIERFVIGLAKKMLIANILGELSEAAMSPVSPSMLFHWLAVIAFALQIYFDFSAYSDMAIGLGRMFGFHFLENFNYPFIAKSVSEFWRRWHISLGTWFREYLYIPLGGNRVSRLKWIRNIFVVWFCTGFWHGANWNFIAWGLYFGVILTFEKIFISKWLDKMPNGFRHLYTLLLVLFSFVIFHIESLQGIIAHFGGMFGAGGIALYDAEALYTLRSYAFVLIFACAGATPAVKNAVSRFKVLENLAPLLCGVLLIICTAYLVDESFNPFLYFRF